MKNLILVFIAFSSLTLLGCTRPVITEANQRMKECAFSSEQKYGLNISGSSDFKSNLSLGANYEEVFKSTVLSDANISDTLKQSIIDNYYACMRDSKKKQ